MRISDWSSDVCSSDLDDGAVVLLERIVAGSSGSALAHSTLARFEVLHLEEGVAADRGDLVGVAPARAGDVVGQEVAGAGHDLGALAGRQRPVALGLDGDRHRLGPGLDVAQPRIGRYQRRGELLARGDHFAHRIAPQAAFLAAQGNLGHGLLAPVGLVAVLTVPRGPYAQRTVGVLNSIRYVKVGHS